MPAVIPKGAQENSALPETICLPIPDHTDAKLMARAARGDEASFGMLYQRHRDRVYRFALQMGGSEEIAEDVTQEVFVTLATSLNSYDESRGTAPAFLLGIARNLVLRRLERERASRCDHSGDAGELPAGEAGPFEVLLQSETAEAVRRAVLALPENYREAVVLCDLQELSYAEAAEAMRCPVGTVRSKLNRGRALLAEKLAGRKRCFA